VDSEPPRPVQVYLKRHKHVSRPLSAGIMHFMVPKDQAMYIFMKSLVILLFATCHDTHCTCQIIYYPNTNTVPVESTGLSPLITNCTIGHFLSSLPVSVTHILIKFANPSSSQSPQWALSKRFLPTKILYAFFISPILATYSAHDGVLDITFFN